MGFRFGRSIKIMPGVRLNVSSRGLGVSAGVPGARIGIGPGGRVTRTLSIPGTGLSHVSTLSGGGGGRRGTGTRSSASTRSSAGSSSKSATRRPTPPPAPRPPAPPKPGLLAPAAEKDFFKAITAPAAAGLVDVTSREHPPHALVEVAARHGDDDPQLRLLCAALEGLWHFIHTDLDDPTAVQRLLVDTTPETTGSGSAPDAARARHLLAWVVAQRAQQALAASAAGRSGGPELHEHPYAVKYLQGQAWGVEITHGITATLGLADDVGHLAAAELHQAAGDLDTAVWSVENAPHPATPTALSLAELYSDAGRHEEVRNLTNAITNVDDATALLLIFRARAFARTGHVDAARECLKEAMKSRSRTPAVRHRALLERAEINLAAGRKAAARKDLEAVLADDATYPGLSEALDALPVTGSAP